MNNKHYINFLLTGIIMIVDNEYSRANKIIKVVREMKKFLIKAIPIAIVGITVFAIVHIIYTITTYDDILTALPLGTIVAIEAALWFIPVLIGIIVYICIKK